MKYYFDGGGTDGNGNSHIAVVDNNKGEIVNFEIHRALTNNLAEYLAGIIAAYLAPMGSKLVGDSQLVIKQIIGEWQVKDDKLKVPHQILTKLVNHKNLEIAWIGRNYNPAGLLLEGK